MKDWYKEQYSNTNELMNLNPEVVNNFDRWIKLMTENGNEIKYNDLVGWGWNTVRLWMHYKGVYCLPTKELIDWMLDEFFPEDEWSDEDIDNKVLEVCCGKGMLGRSLGIKITDNRSQENNPEIMAYANMMGQPLIKYPKDVIRMDANKAAKYYKPHTIIASYLTFGSKLKSVCEESGANYWGPDVYSLRSDCKRLIIIGNLNVQAHRCLPILEYDHKEYTPDKMEGLVTRSDPSMNRIWVWENQ